MMRMGSVSSARLGRELNDTAKDASTRNHESTQMPGMPY